LNGRCCFILPLNHAGLPQRPFVVSIDRVSGLDEAVAWGKSVTWPKGCSWRFQFVEYCLKLIMSQSMNYLVTVWTQAQ